MDEDDFGIHLVQTGVLHGEGGCLKGSRCLRKLWHVWKEIKLSRNYIQL